MFLSCGAVHEMMTTNKYPLPVPKHMNANIARFRKLHAYNNNAYNSEIDTEGSDFNSNKICFDEMPNCVRFRSLANLSKII